MATTPAHDYLLAALGACTSMTMRLCAEGVAAKRFTLRLAPKHVGEQRA